MGGTDQRGPFVGHVSDAVAHADAGVVQEQLALVVGGFFGVLHGEPQVAQRLVGLGERPLEPLGELLGGGEIDLFQDQTSDLCQRAAAIGDHGVTGPARPEGVLVELDLLLAHAAIHQRAQSAVTEWKGLLPLQGGLAIPQAS